MKIFTGLLETWFLYFRCFIFFKRVGFNSIAPYYDQLARLVFGKSIARAQTYFLDRIVPSSNVLVVGGGTGWWLKEFLRINPSCKVLYVEESSEMIRLAKRASAEDHRITFKQGTLDSLSESKEFDAVILFCFLDIFPNEQLEEVIVKTKRSMKSSSLWLITDFVDEKWWHLLMLIVMYRFFKLTTGLRNEKLPQWQKALVNAHLVEVSHKSFFGSFIKSAVYK